MADKTIYVKHPWSMLDLEHYDEFIDALRMQIDKRHPLFRREVFPIAVRRNPFAVIYETDDEPEIYALVYLGPIFPVAKRKRLVNPRTEMLQGIRGVQIRINRDHEQWNAQFA